MVHLNNMNIPKNRAARRDRRYGLRLPYVGHRNHTMTPCTGCLSVRVRYGFVPYQSKLYGSRRPTSAIWVHLSFQPITGYQYLAYSATSTRTIFNPTHAIQPTDDWKSALTAYTANAVSQTSIPSFLILSKQKNVLQSLTHNVFRRRWCFVPAMAREGYPCHYTEQKGIFWRYRSMQQHCRLSGAPHLSESTVVAGLPVMILRTLKELVRSESLPWAIRSITFIFWWCGSRMVFFSFRSSKLRVRSQGR
jgi:hypothetical protein